MLFMSRMYIRKTDWEQDMIKETVGEGGGNRYSFAR